MAAPAPRFFPDPETNVFTAHDEEIEILLKVETHNHPTAISPWPGAATGAGGEIRDEGATGRGAKPKAGLCGFTVSNLNLPQSPQPWERTPSRPAHIASPLDIMIEGPLGAAAYNNEFGRPNLCGYFRTYEQESGGTTFGYHKPIMLAGGLGNIRTPHIEKRAIRPGDLLIVLGGPAMLIGLGGGAASSQAGSEANTRPRLRLRAARQRRDGAPRPGGHRPLLAARRRRTRSFHPRRRCRRPLQRLPRTRQRRRSRRRLRPRRHPSGEAGLSPLEVWCNEAQERYVLALAARTPRALRIHLHARALSLRRRRPRHRRARDRPHQLERPRRRHASHRPPAIAPLRQATEDATLLHAHEDTQHNRSTSHSITIADAVERLLRLPTIACKNFLITIGDRSVGGLTVQDQMVGPWQVPVADCAVTLRTFDSVAGEAMAIGERTPLAVTDAAASARMAVGELITNIAGAAIDKLSDVKLSANWMAAARLLNRNPAKTKSSSTPSTPSAWSSAPRSASPFPSAKTPCR